MLTNNFEHRIRAHSLHVFLTRVSVDFEPFEEASDAFATIREFIERKNCEKEVRSLSSEALKIMKKSNRQHLSTSDLHRLQSIELEVDNIVQRASDENSLLSQTPDEGDSHSKLYKQTPEYSRGAILDSWLTSSIDQRENRWKRHEIKTFESSNLDLSPDTNCTQGSNEKVFWDIGESNIDIKYVQKDVLGIQWVTEKTCTCHTELPPFEW